MAVIHGIQAHWKLIVGILLAAFQGISMMNALREYPHLAIWVHELVDFLSYLTPKDSPGTLKMPFTRSEPPPDCKPRSSGGGGTIHVDRAATTFMVAGLGAILALGLSACCALGQRWCKAQTAVIDCAKEEVRSHGPELLPIISDLLASGSSWDRELDTIAKTLGADGMDIVTCLVAQALEGFQAKMMPGQYKGAPLEMARLQLGSERAQLYLKGKKPTKN